MKKHIEKLKSVLENVSVSDDQKQTIIDFLEELRSTIENESAEKHKATIASLESKIADLSNGDGKTYTIEEGEKALELARADWMEQAEKAFVLAKTDWMEDAEAAFTVAREEWKQHYAESFQAALEEVYDSVAEKAKQDFSESEQYRALQAVIGAVAPIADHSEEASGLRAEIETLRAEKAAILEQKESLALKEVKDFLLEGFEGEEREIIGEFIEAAKSEDETYERFHAAVALVDKMKTKTVAPVVATVEDAGSPASDLVAGTADDDLVIDSEPVLEGAETIFSSEGTDRTPSSPETANPHVDRLQQMAMKRLGWSKPAKKAAVA